MDTTRPLDNAIPSKGAGAPTVTRVVPAGDASSAQARNNAPPATVARSIDVARQLLDTGKIEIRQLDQHHVDELKAAVASGSYQVDAEALADRLLHDAFEEL
ncbi:MAG: flagellar biosynthesis anti-sigma factor FlgM [Deltaproteobacteria bacterium]|nr:flagellar biosynthesis anti-sigma factor FlgM [Deltaproteobacteria bacterium]MCB9787809.1 flagellar biosynthesis anti-sigma factor FlgM [Deltaproteobacteria bacterium]